MQKKLLFIPLCAMLLTACSSQAKTAEKQNMPKEQKADYSKILTTDYLADTNGQNSVKGNYTLYGSLSSIQLGDKDTSTVTMSRLTNPYDTSGTVQLTVSDKKLSNDLQHMAKYSPLKVEVEIAKSNSNNSTSDLTYTAKSAQKLDDATRDHIINVKYLGDYSDKGLSKANSQDAVTWDSLAVSYNQNPLKFRDKYNGKTVTIAAPVTSSGAITDRSSLKQSVQDVVKGLVQNHQDEIKNSSKLSDYIMVSRYYQTGTSIVLTHKATAGLTAKQVKASKARYPKGTGQKYDDTDQSLTLNANGNRAIIKQVADMKLSGGKTSDVDQSVLMTGFPSGQSFVEATVKLKVDGSGITASKWTGLSKISQKDYEAVAKK